MKSREVYLLFPREIRFGNVVVLWGGREKRGESQEPIFVNGGSENCDSPSLGEIWDGNRTIKKYELARLRYL